MTLRSARTLKIDVGARIAELRRAKNLTQQAFAERLGVSVQYVSRVETGRANLGLESLVRFAGRLGVDASVLLECPDRPRTRSGA